MREKDYVLINDIKVVSISKRKKIILINRVILTCSWRSQCFFHTHFYHFPPKGQAKDVRQRCSFWDRKWANLKNQALFWKFTITNSKKRTFHWNQHNYLHMRKQRSLQRSQYKKASSFTFWEAWNTYYSDKYFHICLRGNKYCNCFSSRVRFFL